MSMTFEQLAAEAMSLSIEEKVSLADKLIQTLDLHPRGLLDDLWAEEAKRRLEEVRSGIVQPISAEETAKRVRRAAGL